jgi:hypothetical protein
MHDSTERVVGIRVELASKTPFQGWFLGVDKSRAIESPRLSVRLSGS